jgi:rubrerythrin
MKIQTASATISLARELEESSAKFYEALAERFPEGKDAFLTYARENRKNIVNTERAYYGVISDALEGNYAFNLDSDSYVIKTELAPGAGYGQALAAARELEKIIIKFYNNAVEQSKSLMADVPRAFGLISRKKQERLAKLA